MNRFTEYQRENSKLKPIVGYWACPLVPLEQALKEFFSQINELQRSVTEAKRHCTYPSQDKLTRDESAALLLYTTEAGEHSFYLALNQILREEDRSKIRPWFSYLKLLDTALNKLPTVKGNIWRAVSGNVTSDYKKNQVITWWTVTSCSTSAEVVKAFLKPNQEATLFMIEAVNGKNIAGYTMYPDEHEVILGLGTQLRIVDIGFQHGNLRVVQLKEVNDNEYDDEQDELVQSLAATSVIPKPSNPIHVPTKRKFIIYILCCQ